MATKVKLLQAAAGSSGGGTGSGILTDMDVGSSSLTLQGLDADSSTAYVIGKIQSYHNSSSAYSSIFLSKVSLSDGSVSDTYYDDQSANSAWFIDAKQALLSGNNLIVTGTMGAYYQGYAVYNKSTNYSHTYNAAWKTSTSFSFNSAIDKSDTDYLFTCGTDLFNASDYRAVVVRKDIDNNYTPWSVNLTVTAGQNDRAASVASTSSTNGGCFAVLQTNGNKYPGIWKINEYGGTVWSKRVNPDTTNLVDHTAGSINTPFNAIVVDSSENAYVIQNHKLNTNISTNGRYGVYVYKINTSGVIQWSKLIYRSDGDHTVYSTSLSFDSNGDLLIGGYVLDYTPTIRPYSMFIARMDTSGTLDEFKTFTVQNTLSSSYYYFIPGTMKELSNGNIITTITHNINTSGFIRGMLNVTSDMLGDFDDILVEDYIDNITVTTDSATVSAAGTAATVSYTMNNLTNNLTSTSVTSTVTNY